MKQTNHLRVLRKQLRRDERRLLKMQSQEVAYGVLDLIAIIHKQRQALQILTFVAAKPGDFND